MPILSNRQHFSLSIRLGLLATCLAGQICQAADKDKIQLAIDRGRSFLLSQPKTGPAGTLACYALIKSGTDKQHPEVQQCLQAILSKVHTDSYIPSQHHNYEAGVDAMLLEAIDPKAHQQALHTIAGYLIASQNASGAWYYNYGNNPSYGDTSITQYAVLGLWAASRAGVDIPTETWDKAARWLIQTQREDGGFSYQPFDKQGRLPEHLRSSITMTAAGSGSLLVIRRVLFGNAEFADEIRPATVARRFGVLERIPDESKTDAPKARAAPSVTSASIDRVLKNSVNWTRDHFAEEGRSLTEWRSYYYYGIERMAALLDVEKLGTHDWYQEGADDLLLRQLPDGSLNDGAGPVASTALAILFLSKATASVVTQPKRTPLVGGGLLAGGRGLPENLDAVKITDGQVTARKLQGRVDGLLADLEKSSDAKVEEVQAAVVEVVQLDRPEELIGQVDRLKKLATDGRVEVRRTAMWALGRTGNISAASLLIRGLSDSDESVAREASMGLCILSRKPDGIGRPLDPSEGLDEDADAATRKAHLERWQKESTRLWQAWYQKVRPYEERDDRTQLKRKS